MTALIHQSVAHEDQVGGDEPEVKTRLVDGGAREIRPNGFMREPEGEKPDYTAILTARGLDIVPAELIQRIAEHYYQGGLKYSPNNWKRGTDAESLERNRRSATRHLVQWLNGEDDEDHLAAVVWNLITYEINLRESRRQLAELQEQDVLTVVAGVGITAGETRFVDEGFPE